MARLLCMLPLLEELSRVVGSHLTKDQLLVLFDKKVAEDAGRVGEYMRLAGGLRERMRRRHNYIGELKVLKSCQDAIRTVKLLKRMQLKWSYTVLAVCWFLTAVCLIRQRETLAEGEEGALYLGPERPRVYSDLSPEDKVRMFKQNKCRGNNTRGKGTAGNGGAQNRAENVNLSQARRIKCYNYNGGQDNIVDEDVDELPVQDLALNLDNVFQADECDAFDSDVDEAPTTQTMFMANLSSADPVYDEAGPSYDSDILSEVYDHDNYQDAVCEYHEVHEMHDDVQPNRVVDLDAEYTGDSNMIPYDQYVKENEEPVVQNNVSSIPNGASMMIINEMHKQTIQCVSVKAHTKVVDASLTAELATYTEQVELYERWAKLELTEREQKIEEQLRIVITDRNIKEEN
uniref:Uncharacterized protein n=1 Tax=Tanacetum cinerariifolium TaxID=118510 RepID=A0A6L2MA09_TANCI|nr:hypothetical protein [Tanacetum cinerariifolium]